MRLGVTGTRGGLTVEQFRGMTAWMRANPFRELHHGCCVGADDEASNAAMSIYPNCRRVAHPPTNRGLVSASALQFATEVMEALPYLDRNHAIVDACDVLLALPKGPEEMRSGTWATVRFARGRNKRIVIVWPDGQTTREGG